MDNLHRIVSQLRKQLDEIEAEIVNNEPKPVVEAVEIIDIRTEVAKMSNTKKWKTFINQDYGIVDNLTDIVYDVYDYMRDHILETYSRDIADSIIGKPGTQQWNRFIVQLFRRMVKNGSFIRDDGSYDDFGDTAGGCDEVVQDACFEVINENLKEINN